MTSLLAFKKTKYRWVKILFACQFECWSRTMQDHNKHCPLTYYYKNIININTKFYVFQFYANQHAHLNQLLPIYSSSIRINSPCLSIPINKQKVSPIHKCNLIVTICLLFIYFFAHNVLFFLRANSKSLHTIKNLGFLPTKRLQVNTSTNLKVKFSLVREMLKERGKSRKSLKF